LSTPLGRNLPGSAQRFNVRDNPYRKEVDSIKLIKNKRLQWSFVTEVKVITISPLYETEQTFQRNICILTENGETLELVLYADQKNKLEFSVPLQEKDVSYPM
jgi:hypothetical protein